MRNPLFIVMVALVISMVSCQYEDAPVPESCLPSEAYQGVRLNGNLEFYLKYKYEYENGKAVKITQHDYENDDLISSYFLEYSGKKLSYVRYENLGLTVEYFYSYSDIVRTVLQQVYYPQITDTIVYSSEMFYPESLVDGVYYSPLNNGSYRIENGNFVESGYYEVINGDTINTFVTTYFYDDNPNASGSPLFSFVLKTFSLLDPPYIRSTNNLVKSITEQLDGNQFENTVDWNYDLAGNLLGVKYNDRIEYSFKYDCLEDN